MIGDVWKEGRKDDWAYSEAARQKRNGEGKRRTPQDGTARHMVERTSTARKTEGRSRFQERRAKLRSQCVSKRCCISMLGRTCVVRCATVLSNELEHRRSDTSSTAHDEADTWHETGSQTYT